MIHLRIDGAAGDGIDSDMTWSQLFGQGFCQGVHPSFGGGVGGFTGGAAVAPDRRDVDNASRLSSDHFGNYLFTTVKNGCKIAPQNHVPFFGGHVAQEADMGNSRIINETVNGTKHLFDFLDEGLCFVIEAHIAGK